MALIFAHGKNEMEEIADSQKKEIKRLIPEIQRYLDGNPATFGKQP